MSIKSVTRSRRLIARLGSVLAAALCVGSLAVFSPSASAASKNPDIISGKVYRIVNLGSGHCLNVTGGRDQDNINVNQYDEDHYAGFHHPLGLRRELLQNLSDVQQQWQRPRAAYRPQRQRTRKRRQRRDQDRVERRCRVTAVSDRHGRSRTVCYPIGQSAVALSDRQRHRKRHLVGHRRQYGGQCGRQKQGDCKGRIKWGKTNYQEWRQQQWIITEKTRYSSYVLQIPLEYENGSAYTTNGLACSGHNACITYSGGEQCVAFSREVYARNNGGFRWSNTNATEKKASRPLTSAS